MFSRVLISIRVNWYFSVTLRFVEKQVDQDLDRFIALFIRFLEYGEINLPIQHKLAGRWNHVKADHPCAWFAILADRPDHAIDT